MCQHKSLGNSSHEGKPGRKLEAVRHHASKFPCTLLNPCHAKFIAHTHTHTCTLMPNVFQARARCMRLVPHAACVSQRLLPNTICCPLPHCLKQHTCILFEPRKRIRGFSGLMRDSFWMAELMQCTVVTYLLPFIVSTTLAGNSRSAAL
jgi:hypothetical protein